MPNDKETKSKLSSSDGEDSWEPSSKALDLVGSFARTLSSLQQRDRGFVLANLKDTYFKGQFGKKKDGKKGNKSTKQKWKVNLENSLEGKAYSEILLEIKKWRSIPGNQDQNKKLPADLYEKRQEALKVFLKKKEELQCVRPSNAKKNDKLKIDIQYEPDSQ